MKKKLLPSKKLISIIAKQTIEIERLNKLVERLSFDELTGLPQRHIFNQNSDNYYSKSIRYRRSCIFFLDLNKFKNINDNFGHDAGDSALKYIANTLKNVTRNEDTVYRWSGDEFVIVAETKNPQVIDNRINKALKDNPWEIEGKAYPLSLSIGHTAIHQFSSINEAIKAADELMYKEKTKFNVAP